MCQEKRICSSCNTEKPSDQFYDIKKQCKVCYLAKKREYKKNNRDKIIASNKIYRQTHKEEISAYARRNHANMSQEDRDILNAKRRRRYGAHKENGTLPNDAEKRQQYQKEYREKNYERLKASKEIYVQQNKEAVTKRKREWKKNKLKTDIGFRIENNLRAIFGSAVKRGYKQSSIFDILGCSLDEFKIHIESIWQKGMNWGNWGIGNDKWHIDHILPVASFDMASLEDQKKCWHYTNLRPLWQIENLSKSDYMPDGTRGRNKGKLC